MPSKEKAVVFFDARNIIEGQKSFNSKARGFRSNYGYKEIMDFFCSRFNVVRGYYYDGARTRAKD